MGLYIKGIARENKREKKRQNVNMRGNRSVFTLQDEAIKRAQDIKAKEKEQLFNISER